MSEGLGLTMALEAVETAARGRDLSACLRLLAMALCLSALGLALYLGAVRLSSNFHEVEPQLLYRSAQLDGAGLRAVAQHYGIRSVLTLRGGSSGDAWFDEEAQTLRQLGLRHYQARLSARREVQPEALDDLVRLMRQAPKPLLVHCNAGADRTGLAIAAYALSRGLDLATAQAQLSLRYGHFPYLGSPSSAMDRSLLAYGRHLQLRPRPVAQLR